MIPLVRLGFLARAALAAAAFPLLIAGTPAHAAPGDDAKKGLYGGQDPAYDGTFRQSLAILAVHAAGERVPPAAITWLVEQQCDDGGWTPFREYPSAPCAEKNEDSNSTAMAVQALASVGGLSHEVGQGIEWLSAQQNADGGVGFNPGGATDANSTALFIQALAAADTDPEATTSGGNSPVDALLDLQLGCDAAEEERGAFAFQAAKGGAEPAANDLATTGALFALSGQVPPVTKPGDGEPEQLPCGGGEDPAADDAVPAAAAYLAGVLDESSDTIPAQQGKGSDWGTTASAVIALSAFGAEDEATRAMSALNKRAASYAEGPDGEDAPAGLANLVLAAVATGRNPERVADDAVQRLLAVGPKAPERSTGEATRAAGKARSDEAADENGGWIVAGIVGAIVTVGVFVLLRRRGEHE